MHFLCHLLSVFIGAIGEPRNKYPVDKYTKESNGMALFLLKVGSI